MSTRREFIRGAGATALIAAPATLRAQARDPLVMMTPFGFIPDFIDMMNAIAGGHFAAQNIEARLVGGQGAVQPIQQLITGQADFTRQAGVDVIRAVATTHAPLLSIGTIYQGSTFHMISLKDKPIRSAEDLKGKTVGVVSVGGSTEIFLDLILAKGGLKKEDVKREVAGNSPGVIQLVKQGRVDCFIASIQVVAALDRMKEAIEVWSTDRYAPMPGQCYVTTQQIADKKSELLTRAMKAMRASADEIMTKPLKPIFERAAKSFEIPGIRNVDELAEVEKLTADKLWLSEGRENLLRNVPKLWESGVQALRSTGATIASAEALYTNKFVDG